MNSSKEATKESKSFHEKVKQLFRSTKPTGGPPKQRVEYILPDSIQNDLGRSAPISTRLKFVKELTEIAIARKLEDRSVEKIWNLIQDLLAKEQPHEVRHLALTLLQSLIKGQYERLGIMRAHFFRFIKSHDHPDDVVFRFELLLVLTDHGKDILYFEDEVGNFLIQWFPEICKIGRIKDYLGMLVTIVKFNAAYIDEFVITELVRQTGELCYVTYHQGIVLDCLQVMDTILAYSYVPSNALPDLVAALCRVVVGEVYCQMSWKVMRNLMGTHMGHSAVYTMCSILQQKRLEDDSGLLRGAVFFIYTALWGNQQPLTNLVCPPSSILPSILQAARSKHPGVTHEVILSIQYLITKSYSELFDAEWDIIIIILGIIVRQIATAPDLVPHQMASACFHETLNVIENLIEVGTFHGSTEKFYEVVAECAPTRPETSIFRLITFIAHDILPTTHLWLTKLDNLLKKYYRQDTRTNIRLKVLSVLSKVIKLNRDIYEDELVEHIVLPHLNSIVNDSDGIVRTAVTELLVDVCMECESKKCLELLDILERLIFRPFENYSDDVPLTEPDIADVKSAVLGIINVFVHKIYRLPSSHAVKIYKMLVTFLEEHYKKQKMFEDCNLIRYKIFDCFLKMRADHLCRIGYPDSNGKLRFSPYLLVTGSERSTMGSPPPFSPAINQQPACVVTYVPLRRAFKIFIACLRQEKDWEVLQLVLQGLPQVLQNRSLILSKQGNNEIDLLVDTLIAMITDRTLCLPESLKNPVKLNRSEFHASVLMVVASLASYHLYLGQVHQQRMIRCLVKYGLVPRCSKQCIMALTICTLEMKDVMVKMLPEVLLDLSKVSATVHIAAPVLEFLSTLAKLPTIYANFVGDQYMAVFAISLPFTNPFKYNHYIVSLAHHVLAVWFLKCRQPFRQDFITYITKGLQTNVLVPFEETGLRTNLSSLNEDSSNRKRSSSLTEQSSRRRERVSTMARPDGKPSMDFRPPMDRTLITFYEELTETCMDFMSRYTFFSCSAMPRRLPTTDYLLSNGNSKTWFLGNKLITITTTGCSLKPIKHGFCDKCWHKCGHSKSKSPDAEQIVPKTTRTGSTDKERDEAGGSALVTRQNSGEKSNNNTSTSSPIEENKKLSNKLDELPSKLQQLLSTDECKYFQKQNMCSCWCQCWSEIYIRRPTGDVAWTLRFENQLSQHMSNDQYPLTEFSNSWMPTSLQQQQSLDGGLPGNMRHHSEELINPEPGPSSSTTSVPISIPGSPSKQSPSRQSSRDSIEEDMENVFEDGSKSRNPVRRSNSSPEMSASWKNPFLQKQEREQDDARVPEEDGNKKTKTFTKDMRVSCEAIPEEIAGMGTTPPSNEPVPSSKGSLTTQHPALLSCHSYPGSAPSAEQPLVPKPAHTVPPSPNVLTSTAPPTLPLAQISQLKDSALHGSKLKASKSESGESVGSEKALERPTTLSSLSNLPPLSSKPPQSPTQTSPRLPRHVQTKEGHEIQKSSSLNLERTHSLKMKEKKSDNEKQSHADLSQTQKRDRGYTISVMNTTRNPWLDMRQSTSSRPRQVLRSGISPTSVFLQMYYTAQFGSTNEKPLLVTSNQVVQRAMKVLDCIPPYETHRIGVLYVGEGQCNNEPEILRNRYGSLRYMLFLEKLGTLIKLQDVDPQMVFLGGLEQNGNDGKYTYIWQDDVIKVAFHVATDMPTKESDPNCTNKKTHIGNNNVTIVYNESGEEYNLNTIKGQFNFACIIVQPLDHQANKVTVKAKDELIDLMGSTDPKIVSDENVALLARQLALHADLASLVSRSLKSQSQDPYASNWLERLRKIKNVRAKILQETKKEQPAKSEENPLPRSRWIEDFSDYM